MTREQYIRLAKYDKQIKSGYYSNYTRFSKVEFDDFLEVYKELYNKTLTPAERGCSTCKLKAVKKVAADYYAYRAWALKFKGESWLESNSLDTE